MRDPPENNPHQRRQQALRVLGEEVLDVLVLGGGIVGSGVARDAAIRGLRVGLVEQSDFASGTSSRSSHLLHGGLRYLAQGYLRLVHEASMEKRVIHRIAPHLADPLAFVFPTRPGWTWTKWKLSAGVKLYDLLCGRRNLGKSSTLGRRAVHDLLPGLTKNDITGAVRYYDGLTNDARLVIDTIRSAANHGALAANYVGFIDAELRDDLWRCRARDDVAGGKIEIRTHQVVNATGPWSDRIPHSHTQLRLTKGVHLVIDRRRLPIPDAVVLTEGDRILFAIPWGERVILGTTDTDYDGPIESPGCDEADVAYVLDVVAVLFPEAGISKADVLSFWAGLRPLVADRHGNPSDISRRHEITMGEPGWWDVTGGKLTTYRLMAEQTVDRVAGELGRPTEPCRTAEELLLPASETEGLSAVIPPPVTERAVKHYCRNEWARHLDDVMIRRTYWHHYRADRQDVAPNVAGWMAEVLGWDPATTAAELAAYLAAVREETSRFAMSQP